MIDYRHSRIAEGLKPNQGRNLTVYLYAKGNRYRSSRRVRLGHPYHCTSIKKINKAVFGRNHSSRRCFPISRQTETMAKYKPPRTSFRSGASSESPIDAMPKPKMTLTRSNLEQPSNDSGKTPPRTHRDAIIPDKHSISRRHSCVNTSSERSAGTPSCVPLPR